MVPAAFLSATRHSGHQLCVHGRMRCASRCFLAPWLGHANAAAVKGDPAEACFIAAVLLLHGHSWLLAVQASRVAGLLYLYKFAHLLLVTQWVQHEA